MKKFLSFLFFSLFVIILFSGTESIRLYWSDDANIYFLISEIEAIFSKLSPYWDMIKPYGYYILGFLLIDLITLLFIFRKRTKKLMKIQNPLTEGKTVIDGSSIVSKESLPKSEGSNLKTTGPFISKEMIEKNIEP